MLCWPSAWHDREVNSLVLKFEWKEACALSPPGGHTVLWCLRWRSFHIDAFNHVRARRASIYGPGTTSGYGAVRPGGLRSTRRYAEL